MQRLFCCKRRVRVVPVQGEGVDLELSTTARQERDELMSLLISCQAHRNNQILFLIASFLFAVGCFAALYYDILAFQKETDDSIKKAQDQYHDHVISGTNTTCYQLYPTDCSYSDPYTSSKMRADGNEECVPYRDNYCFSGTGLGFLLFVSLILLPACGLSPLLVSAMVYSEKPSFDSDKNQLFRKYNIELNQSLKQIIASVEALLEQRQPVQMRRNLTL